jgi:hypothetical protein
MFTRVGILGGPLDADDQPFAQCREGGVEEIGNVGATGLNSVILTNIS